MFFSCAICQLQDIPFLLGLCSDQSWERTAFHARTMTLRPSAVSCLWQATCRSTPRRDIGFNFHVQSISQCYWFVLFVRKTIKHIKSNKEHFAYFGCISTACPFGHVFMSPRFVGIPEGNCRRKAYLELWGGPGNWSWCRSWQFTISIRPNCKLNSMISR